MHKPSLTYIVLLTAVSLLLLGSALWFYVDLTRLHHQGAFVNSRLPYFFHRGSRPLAVRTAPIPGTDFVQSWMTFAYINKSFDLPQNYLKDKLGIKSTLYPNIAIRSAAAAQKIALDQYLQKVKDTIIEEQTTVQK